MNIHTVLEHFEDHLLGLPNVVGVGIGEHDGKEVIEVLVTHKVPRERLRAADVIPAELEGIATHVLEVGRPEALPEP